MSPDLMDRVIGVLCAVGCVVLAAMLLAGVFATY